MSEHEAKRQALAALVARRQGLGDPAALDSQQRAAIDREVEAVADGLDAAAPEPADPEAAQLHRAAAEYRAARQLRADEDNVRLAERGEVFAPEDDA
ncbi:MAG: hypothetical protein WAP03_26250 [Methylorubrum rhodinum]|uniref:hypothetical protein n=1 Tax=Methylorubrum rhodinum TaxID=29428 RepID=UPI003BB01ADB